GAGSGSGGAGSGSGGAAGARAGVGQGWRRLHPLSPVVRFSRSLFGLLIALAVSTLAARKDPSGSYVFDVVLVGIALVSGFVSWLVTRWQVEGSTLRVESGLIRRDSRQVPLSRVQAIDVVQPVVARALGLAELRLRVAGSRSEVRLAYLTEAEARATRARLLALARGSDQDAPAPAETALASVSTSQLVAAVALSGPGITAIGTVGLLIGLGVSIPGAVGSVAGSGVAVVIALVGPAIRRVTSEGSFSLAEAPDGLRVRCGLVEKVAETIPAGRVQAVRRVEPLAWRLFGWCRLEVAVAGSRGRQRKDEPAGRVVRALLPVGSHERADAIVARLLPDMTSLGQPPPGRARWKAPLSYHFLAGGHDQLHAVTSGGRVCKVTAWIPLAKVQSLRFVQGPAQRRLGLANVHLDVAGRRIKATFRDRGVAEATDLVETLAELCRVARSPGPEARSDPAGEGA
ncbi:MAG: PH domain-containing protein, partial [Acidimicrobiales bacterium]